MVFVFYIFHFPPGVYFGTLNLIASIPGPSFLILFLKEMYIYCKLETFFVLGIAFTEYSLCHHLR